MSELQCYNRGCGKKYLPEENSSDSCQHHPGEPVFHDAYKGWSCCNKKCTDFTEFLNIKGCTISMHSNIKPPEPEKPQAKDIPDAEIIVVQPIKARLERPPYDTPLIKLKPELAPSLQQSFVNAPVNDEIKVKQDDNEIQIGTVCKNGGCNVGYEGPETNNTPCVHHPGSPVFHEGMKFWSCCQKRTSDFNAFLNQIGCTTGTHVWKKKDDDHKSIQCRWDFHQTGTHVIVSIYAKQYCPSKSKIQINPIRLNAQIVFPQEADAVFNMDYELHGVIDVQKSNVTMYGTKVEIKLKKAEPGSWSRLEILNPSRQVSATKQSEKVDKLQSQVESVDLSDL